MPRPMTTTRLASLRPAGAASLALVAALALGACSSADPTPTDEPSLSADPTPTLAPTPSPTVTPAPTPRFTNEPDPEIAALIPTTAAGLPVVVAPFDEFALTPGDIGAAFGEIGDRFASLALAYVEQPRTTLYAMRVDGDPVTTEGLEPHLATAGRYVGIAGLHREPWQLVDAGGSLVWVRPEDNATAAGTMIYTWASGEFVFLLIGVDDNVNRAILAALPAEPAPTPTPLPSLSGDPSAAPSAAPSAGDGGG
jgi:hypothetical protein